MNITFNTDLGRDVGFSVLQPQVDRQLLRQLVHLLVLSHAKREATESPRV